MNYGTFGGRLGRDAEIRSTGSGKDVCNFSLGVTVGYGEKKETLWIDAAIWGERGKKLCQYLTKGTSVCIAGDIGLRTYQAKDGTAKAVLTCNAQAVTLMGGGEQKAAPTPKPAPAPVANFDDELPPF